jgi:hypothetical protein
VNIHLSSPSTTHQQPSQSTTTRKISNLSAEQKAPNVFGGQGEKKHKVQVETREKKPLATMCQSTKKEKKRLSHSHLSSGCRFKRKTREEMKEGAKKKEETRREYGTPAKGGNLGR